jgi:hypothetical protein
MIPVIDRFAIDEDAYNRLIDLFRRAAEPGVSQHARPWRPAAATYPGLRT